MKKKTYENPRDEAIGVLEENIVKIRSYLTYIERTDPSSTKIRHEEKAIQNLKRAIAFLKRCPPGGQQ